MTKEGYGERNVAGFVPKPEQVLARVSKERSQSQSCPLPRTSSWTAAFVSLGKIKLN